MGDMDQINVLELLHEIRDGWDEKALGDDRKSKVRHWMKTLEASQALFKFYGSTSLWQDRSTDSGSPSWYRPTVENATPTPT